jgi:hypothetical protein
MATVALDLSPATFRACHRWPTESHRFHCEQWAVLTFGPYEDAVEGMWEVQCGFMQTFLELYASGCQVCALEHLDHQCCRVENLSMAKLR